MLKRLAFSALSVLAVFLCLRPAFSAEYFDALKYRDLELEQRNLLAEEEAKTREAGKAEEEKGEEAPTEPGWPTDLKPSQPGYYLITAEQAARSEELIQEELRIKSQRKSLRERLHCYLNSSINYDSNVFYERKPSGDFYYTVDPGVFIDATDLWKQLGFTLGLGCSWQQYFSYARLNSISPSIALSVPGIGKKIRIARRLTMSFDIGINVSPKVSPNTQDQGLMTNTVFPYVSMNLDYLLSQKFSIGLSYNLSASMVNNKVETAEGTETLDTGGKKNLIIYDQSVFLRPRYHITPKTTLFVGYGMGATRSNGSQDDYYSNYLRVTAGAEGRLTAKSVVSLEAGWENRSFKGGRKASNMLYLQGAYLVQLTKKWSASLTAIRDFNPSILANENLYTTTGMDLSINYRPVPKWTAGLATRGRWNESEQRKTDDVATGTAATGTAAAGTEAETEAEDTSNYTVGFSPSLRFSAKRWLAFGLKYDFDMRFANARDDEYFKHLATFDVNIYI